MTETRLSGRESIICAMTGQFSEPYTEAEAAELIDDANRETTLRATAAALRTASHWLRDDDRDMLCEAADRTERSWDGGCCPICEETFCDGGCPLEDVRAEMYRREAAEAKVPAEDSADHERASWPLPPGVEIHYRGDPDDTAAQSVANVARSHEIALPTLMEMIRNNPNLTPAGNGSCYAASWGMVHSRPSCRCSR